MPTKKFEPTIMDKSGAVGTRMSLEEFGGKEEGWKHDHQGVMKEMSESNKSLDLGTMGEMIQLEIKRKEKQ